MMKADTVAEKERVVEEAEQASAKLSASSSNKKKSEMYIKIMRKIISDGDEFVGKETKRTAKMKEGKITGTRGMFSLAIQL